MTSDSQKQDHKQRLSWKVAPIISLLLGFGPLILTIFAINLSDATLLDGLFGVYTNTPFQQMIINVGALITVAGPIMSLIFSIVFVFKRTDLTPLKRSLPILVPFVIVVILVLFGLLAGSIGITF